MAKAYKNPSWDKIRELPKRLAGLYQLEVGLLGDCPLKPALRAYDENVRSVGIETSFMGDCDKLTPTGCKFALTGYICSINARIRYYSMLRKGGLRNGINTETGE